MRAVVAEQVSKPEDLTIIELPEPIPGPGQIRIDVKATALNFADTLIIGHKYQVRPDFPFSPDATLSLVLGGAAAPPVKE